MDNDQLASVLILLSRLDPTLGRRLHLAWKHLSTRTTSEQRLAWYRCVADDLPALRLSAGHIVHSFGDPIIVSDRLVTNGSLLQRLFVDPGGQIWIHFGKLHRENGPAMILGSGDQIWCNNGLAHRDNDLPAIICNDGTRYWVRHGLRHRSGDLPAIIHPDGTKEWYQHGQLHRDHDRPAVVHVNGTKEWHLNGQLHRDHDQPAIIYSDGSVEWYHHGCTSRKWFRPVFINSDGRRWWCSCTDNCWYNRLMTGCYAIYKFSQNLTAF